MLDVTLLSRAVDDCLEEGYDYLGVSGGEPLLYPDLRALLLHAKGQGMFTAVATNGVLLNKKRVDNLLGAVDAVAVSVDGIPTSHNTMRNSPKAFERMQERLQLLREADIPFGLIFTLTMHNLDELAWVVDFAIAEQASLVQIHPLEKTGFAANAEDVEAPDGQEAAYAWLLANKLQEQYQGRLQLHLDFLFSEAVRFDPEKLGIDTLSSASAFSEVISPLVIESDGTVVPLQYGFDRHFAVGHLHQGRLRQQFDDWREHRLPAFTDVCRTAYDDVLNASTPHFFNWYQLVTAKASAVTHKYFASGRRDVHPSLSMTGCG